MASVNFKKLKGSDVKSMLRHCDSAERLKRNHRNHDIDKTRTRNNINYAGLSYNQSCRRYDNRIRYLDSLQGANKRKDRVTCFGLTVPACRGMGQKESSEFFRDVCKVMVREYGKENVISMIGHYDEIHCYLDKGEVQNSRPHLHLYIVPEINGKLNGKRFSSKGRMREINKQIDELARTKYQCPFLTGEVPRKKTVEELKQVSDEELEIRQKQIKELDVSISKRQQERDELTRTVEELNQNIMQSNDKLKELTGEILDEEGVKRKKIKRSLFSKDKIEMSYRDYQDLCRTAEKIDEVSTREWEIQEKEEAYKKAMDGVDKRLKWAVNEMIRRYSEQISERNNLIDSDLIFKELKQYFTDKGRLEEYESFDKQLRKKIEIKVARDITNRYKQEYDYTRVLDDLER